MTMPQPSRDEMIQMAIDQSSNGVIDRTSLVTIAKKHGYSSGYFANIFKKSAGWGLYDISDFIKDRTIVQTKLGTSDADKVKEAMAAVMVVQETDEEIITRQRKKFRTLDRMIEGVISGSVRSVIVSGPAGIGKTYTIETALESACDQEKIQYTAIKGFVRASGLYKALWENRESNQVILLDDADSAFQDDVSLNILKAALDSSKRRVISWRSEKTFVDEVGEEIPRSFDYRGSVIFITNLNFEKLIAQGRALAPHFAALVSRSFYVDLNMQSQREQLLRVFDILDHSSMVDELGLCHEKAAVIKGFIREHYNEMTEISLRMVSKLTRILSFTHSTEDFNDIATSVCLRNSK